MAIKASAHITLSRVVGIEAYNRYYLLQSSTLATPAAPTEYPPPSSPSSITWDGDTTALEVLQDYYFKVSDLVPSMDSLVGQTFVGVDADGIHATEITLETLATDSSYHPDCVYFVHNGFMPLIYVVTADFTENGVTYGAGTYFVNLTGVGQSLYISELTLPSSGGWNETEPAYTPESTESLYFTDCVLFSDGTFDYSDVSLSSSYEAAKTAYNSAIAAGASASDALSAAQTAQESADTATSNLNSIIGDIQADLDSAKEDIADIQDSNAEVYEVVYQNQSKISELVQVSSGFEMSFQTITDSITQINDQYVTDRDEQYKYIRFIDGEIWIGKLPEEGEDDLQLVMRNDRISFLMNNVEIAYFSDDALYVTNVTVTGKLTIGRWEWNERANGNLGLRWVGE